MRTDYLKQNLPFPHRNIFLKLLLTLFFVGLAFRILFFHSLSSQISPVLESPFPQKDILSQPHDPPRTEALSQPVSEPPPVVEHVPEPPPDLGRVPEPPPVLEFVSETEDQLSPTESGEWWVLFVLTPLSEQYSHVRLDLQL